MKTNKIILFFSVLAATLFMSCSDSENITFDAVNGQTLINFVGATGSVPVNSTGVSSTAVNLQISTVSASERTLTVVIDETSTANSSQYSLTEFIVPAGEYLATGVVTGNYGPLPAIGAVTLVLKVTGVSGSESVSDRDTFTVTLERFCPLVIEDFYGTYSVASGFNGAAPSTVVDATITAGPVANTLRITNLHATGRSAIIELDYSDIKNPKVIHRSEEFEAVFQVAGLGNTFTEDILGDVDKNVFNSCSKEIKLFFYRRIAQPDGRYYGGSYEVILNKQ
jgi:hypothetical protein